MSYLTQPSSETAHSQNALGRVKHGFYNVPIHGQDWTPEQILHVAVPYENPCRWDIRRKLFNDARHHLGNVPCVKIHVGEVAIGDEPFEVTGLHEGDVQFRCDSVLFHKEGIINRIIESSFPPDWKYGAYFDADFTFNRHDWAIEAIHKLQLHPFVQLFSSYINLSASKPYGMRMTDSKPNLSFAATYIDNGHKLPPEYEPGGWGCDIPPSSEGTIVKGAWIPVGATGGAWAFTREAYDTTGGFLDTCILGHCDWFTAFGLVSQPTRGIIAKSKFHKNYTATIQAWQQKAAKLNKNIGVVDNFAVHHFHGPKVKRAYGSRDQILVKHNFDPLTDLRKNSYGIYELTNDKPDLRDDIRRYMIDRMEDSW